MRSWNPSGLPSGPPQPLATGSLLSRGPSDLASVLKSICSLGTSASTALAPARVPYTGLSQFPFLWAPPFLLASPWLLGVNVAWEE